MVVLSQRPAGQCHSESAAQLTGFNRNYVFCLKKKSLYIKIYRVESAPFKVNVKHWTLWFNPNTYAQLYRLTDSFLLYLTSQQVENKTMCYVLKSLPMNFFKWQSFSSHTSPSLLEVVQNNESCQNIVAQRWILCCIQFLAYTAARKPVVHYCIR